MAITVFPRLSSQPSPALALRKGHWSTRNLLICCPMVNGSPALVGNLQKGNLFTAGTSTGIANGVKFTATTGSLDLLSSGSNEIVPTRQATVLIVLTKSDATNRPVSAFGVNSSTSGTFLHANIPWSDGVVYFDFGVAASELGASGLTVSGTHAWAFTGGLNGMAIYQDGKRVASNSGAKTRTNAPTAAFGLNYGGGAQGDLQITHFFALLDAEWSPSQVMEWAANPWLMFAAPPWRVGVAGAAASTHLSPFLVGCTT